MFSSCTAEIEPRPAKEDSKEGATSKEEGEGEGGDGESGGGEGGRHNSTAPDDNLNLTTDKRGKIRNNKQTPSKKTGRGKLNNVFSSVFFFLYRFFSCCCVVLVALCGYLAVVTVFCCLRETCLQFSLFTFPYRQFFILFFSFFLVD